MAQTTFQELTESWHEGTRFMSSVTEMELHPAFQRLAQMGDAIVPLIFAEMLQEVSWLWILLLHKITEENPIPDEAGGKIYEMTYAWLRWGWNKGYFLLQVFNGVP